MAIKSLDELGIKPVKRYENTVNGGGKIKSLEELGIQPVRRSQDAPGTNQNNNNNNMAPPIDSAPPPPSSLEQPAAMSQEMVAGDPLEYRDKPYAVPENDVGKAKSSGAKVSGAAPPPPEPDTYGKFAARSAKTIGSAIAGGTADALSSIYNIPASLHNATLEVRKNQNPDYMGEHDFIPVSQQQSVPLIPSATHAINKSVDAATGDYTKTEHGDSFQSGLEAVGSVLSAGGLAKAAVKGGQHAIGKALGAVGTTNPVGLGAAGAAGYASSEASNAGYGVASSLAAGLGAGAGAGALGAAAKTLNVKLALATLTGNSPKNIDLKAVKAAESAGIPYANTIVNESKGLALAEQLVSKSPIIGTRYAKKMEAHDKAFGDIVENSINKVGEKIIDSDSPLDTGTMLKDVMVDTKNGVEREASILYKISSSQLPKDSDRVPHALTIALKKIERSINTLRPSEAESFVLNYIKETKSKLFSKEKVPDTKFSLSHDFEFKYIPNDKTAQISNVSVPMKKLIGSKVSLNDTIDWDLSTPAGAKQKLKMIQNAYLEDIATYGKENHKWYTSFKEAEEYYGKNLGDKGLGNKNLRKQIFAQENPEKIIPNLRNISDFKYLGNVLDKSPISQKFFESIKREKLADLMMGKAINPQSEAVSYAGFSKVIENKQNKELIKYLAGDNYKDLRNFSQYAQAAVRRNQRNPNLSGTAPTKAILGAVGTAFTATVAGGLISGITGGVAPLAGTAVLGSALSWLVNNKTALKWGVDAAKKQAAGDYKAVTTYSRRLENAMKKDLGEDFVKQFVFLSEQDQQE